MNDHDLDAYGELGAGISEILFTAAEIGERVGALGAMISRDYAGLNPIAIGALKGVLPFMADLLRAVAIPIEVEFMSLASYSAESRDRGVVRLEKDVGLSIAGRHVLFVEDVIDTGLTLNYLLRNLRAREPASIEVCALFDRERRRLIDIPVKYKGFDLPDRFVVGYGLDFRERYRNLPFVGILKPEIFSPGS